jgi:ribosomal protein S18 acetylase RimI-like enzyme
MNHMVDIIHTSMSDLEFIYELFEHSIRYQEKKGYHSWKNYDKQAVVKDIEDNNHYKVVINSRTAIVFSIAYSDKIIWRTMDTGDSLYLHRIVVNPQCKGQKLFGTILAWTIEHAKQRKLKTIRLDTWADNPTLIAYYRNFGFTVVENFTTPDTNELPVHNRNLALTLLKYEL